MRRLRRLWLDVRMGQCSGFPLCCVTWYVTGWKLLFGTTAESVYDKSAWRSSLILWYHRKGGGAGYVPCPLCVISGARVAVRSCTDRCGHIEESRRLIQEDEAVREY